MAKREAEIIMTKHWRIIVVVFLVDVLVSQSLNNIRIGTTDDLPTSWEDRHSRQDVQTDERGHYKDGKVAVLATSFFPFPRTCL